MDRNKWEGLEDSPFLDVALRKESVDRNILPITHISV